MEYLFTFAAIVLAIGVMVILIYNVVTFSKARDSPEEISSKTHRNLYIFNIICCVLLGFLIIFLFYKAWTQRSSIGEGYDTFTSKVGNFGKQITTTFLSPQEISLLDGTRLLPAKGFLDLSNNFYTQTGSGVPVRLLPKVQA
jgi:NADH:ubiquinone oxidoreductase subunit 6 (subunit J)